MRRPAGPRGGLAARMRRLAGPRAGLAGALCAAWLSAVADGQGEGMSAPPYDAVMPNSVSFPVDPEAVLNESDPLQHTPFASATYTYHAGTFDVHTNDTVRDGSTMISNGVFAFADLNQSMIIEADFWEIVDGWEALGTERFATPVLGVGHSRVFHTISANGQRWPWRERLLDDELDEFRELGFKQARLAFQWVEAEPNWEQQGLQYMYLEYLGEVKRLNSGIHPRVQNFTNETHWDDLGPNPEYMVPTLFSSFISMQGYDANAVLDATAMNSHSRPPGSIFPGINYTALAPELESNWKPAIGRGIYFKRVFRPVINETMVDVQHVNMTNVTFGETLGMHVELEARVIPGATPFATPFATAEAVPILLPISTEKDAPMFTVAQLVEQVYAALSIPEEVIVHLASTGKNDDVLREFLNEEDMMLALNITVPTAEGEGEEGEDVEAEDDEGEAEVVVVETVPEPEPENRTIMPAELAGVCTCTGDLPPSHTCREWVPKACLEHESLPFCQPCVDQLIDHYAEEGACATAITEWVAESCNYDELRWSDYSFGQVRRPKPFLASYPRNFRSDDRCRVC